MDIGYVSNVVYPFVKGGAEKRIHEIGTRLAADGHDVTVYGRHFWDGPPETTHEGLTLRAVAPGTELYTDDRRSITEALDFSARLVAPFGERLRAADHDLLVVSVFPYFPVFSAKLAGAVGDTPVVTTWHEVWRSYWDEYLGPLAFGGKIVERAAARVPQHPVAVSGVTADRLAQIGPDRESITVIPNGIDVGRIERATLPADADGYDVLFAGRLIADKNVSLLLEAFDAVAEEHDATLGIVGDGPERDRLRRQAEGLTNAGRVDMLGFLDEYEHVLGHMAAARVFASPSTREGFGITFAEAMAADCTVVAADHPDSAADEVIGDAGFVVEPTVERLRETLDAVLGGRAPPRDPVERARQYDWDNVASAAAERYARVVRQG
ncbi:glycosyltransferase family 4 protein [Haloplanus ruber]|uniref:Glycosyltransferase family 4 protein n=1 Tax=Haloplanus ruber TaxID=869892 RepID=A0ABD6CZD1_9EURY|nr:glycosyltransferase family 4 protein [Haloplanus ruber]